MNGATLRKIGGAGIRWISRHPLLVLLTSAAVAALASLPAHWFTYNEVMHINDGRVDVPTLSWVLALASEEIHGPFYATAAWTLLSLGIDSEIPFRLVSVACYVAAVAVCYLLARDALGPRGALVAGAFVATNPFVLLFAHLFVRYDLHLLLGLLATRQLLNARTTRGWRPALLLGLWLGAGLLNLFTLGFALPAFALVWVWLWRSSVNRVWPAVAGVIACLAAAAVYLPILAAPPTHHGKSPFDLSMARDMLELVGDFPVVLAVGAILALGALQGRGRTAPCFRFADDQTPWLGVHLILLGVPIGSLILFSTLVMPCTDPWYVLPCVASAGILFGALHEGSTRRVRALLLGLIALQALGSIAGSRDGNPLVVRDVELFATTTDVLESLPDRRVPVLVTPVAIASGVELYHRREGRGDLRLVSDVSGLGELPAQLCVLRWSRLYREDEHADDAAREVMRHYTDDPSTNITTPDVELRCFERIEPAQAPPIGAAGSPGERI